MPDILFKLVFHKVEEYMLKIFEMHGRIYILTLRVWDQQSRPNDVYLEARQKHTNILGLDQYIVKYYTDNSETWYKLI